MAPRALSVIGWQGHDWVDLYSAKIMKGEGMGSKGENSSGVRACSTGSRIDCLPCSYPDGFASVCRHVCDCFPVSAAMSPRQGQGTSLKKSSGPFGKEAWQGYGKIAQSVFCGL